MVLRRRITDDKSTIKMQYFTREICKLIDVYFKKGFKFKKTKFKRTL